MTTDERLARIETKLDALLELEKRVSSLERWKAYVVGFAAAVSAFGVWLAGKVGVVFQQKG